MLAKRVIVCLDVRDGRVTKGKRFQDNVDIGDPVTMAERYYRQGVDELVFYDITASSDRRAIMIDVVKNVAARIFIPFSVGGGIRTVDDMRAVLLAGAEKVSINSAAVRRPALIAEGARAFGSQCIVLGMDVLATEASRAFPSGYMVKIDGGRVATELDAVKWAQRGEALGAGEICLNSIDADGLEEGYELTITHMIAEAVGIPVIASGGGGRPEHLVEVLTAGKADAALVASIVHFDRYPIPALKRALVEAGVCVRRL